MSASSRPSSTPSSNHRRRLVAKDTASRVVCPFCRDRLSPEEAAFSCAACERRFPIEDGIARFVGQDEFYEGVYEAVVNYLPGESPLSLVPLYLINTHYLWWVRRYVAPGSRLLELGVGGGVRFFAQHTRATGLDLSFSSLHRLDAGYELALQADALRLPLADGSYDAVAASYFYEHIRPEDKGPLLAELSRVLRPGGRVVLLFDVASQNPGFRWLRRDAEKFNACFVEHDHHYGLETVTENLARFRAAGFRVLGQHLANKTVQHLPVYQWARGYDHPVTTALAEAAQFISNHPWLGRGYVAGVTLLDDLIEPLFPADWARIMLVVLEKA